MADRHKSLNSADVRLQPSCLCDASGDVGDVTHVKASTCAEGRLDDDGVSPDVPEAPERTCPPARNGVTS